METKNIVFFNKLHLSCIFLLFLLLNPFLLFAELANSSLPTKINSSSSSSFSSSSPHPFSFLKDLVGIPKGKESKGIAKLKTYLLNLGYINVDDKQSNSSEKADHRNIFDDKLEEALKKYQAFFGLQVTGGLDRETVKKLSLPRCGFPDIIRHHNRSSSQLNNQTQFSSSLYSFFDGTPKWSSTNLTYSYDVSYGPSFAARVINDSFYIWAETMKFFTFTYTAEYKFADIKISFQKGDHGDGAPFNRSILGHSEIPPSGVVHINADEDWSYYGEKDKFDLVSVVLHELGHALGLAHSTDENALMYPLTEIGERNPIRQDDIEGMKALYNQ